MKLQTKRLCLVLGCLSAVWAIGFSSNEYVAARAEREARLRVEARYSNLRQFWITRGFAENMPNRPTNLPAHPQWLSPEQIEIVYQDEDHYEITINNEKGYFSIPRPAFMRRGWYEPTTGSIPWAFTARRTMWIPFYVKVECSYQIGPLSGFGGYEWSLGFFGWPLKRGGGIYWLS
jgi:hypothetical protein